MARGGGYIRFMNGRKSLQVEDLDTVCENLKELFDNQERTITKLNEQLKNLKEEKWADEQLQKMKIQLDETQKGYQRGFPISEAELEKIKEWRSNHDAKEHNNPSGYHGAIGGNFIYEFYPTAIGTVGTCICAACRRRAYLEASLNGEYDVKTYNDYMEKHNGNLEFQGFD